jgi:hypothetical protein
VFSDGVDFGSNIVAPGGVYSRVDPKDSFGWGIDIGVFVTPQVEVGFLYNNQPSKLVVSGTREVEVGDMGISGYHGTFTYNTGDADAKVRGYIMGGLGATSFGEVSYTGNRGPGTITSSTRFSSTWGAGVKVYGGSHVGGRFSLLFTPTYIKSESAGYWCDPYWGCYLVGDEVLEPVRVQRRHHVPVLTALTMADSRSSRTLRPPGRLVRRTDAAVSA